MAAETPITEFMHAFRECARNVWNTYFQPLDDGWHVFINVEHALFSGLVLARLELPEGQWTKDARGFFPAIGAVPDIPPRGLPIMFVDPARVDGTVAWREARLYSADFDMRFMEFFDFANPDDPRDFRYARVHVLGGPDPVYVGKDVLLEMPHVTFVQRAVT